VLIFANMKRTAERLEETLEANGFHAAAITGDVDQRRRLRILGEFKDGTLPILVATDVASRGLHIDGVSHVVNFDVPLDPEDYVHRVGRTARAGASGNAVTLACEDYVEGLEPIEKFIGFKLPFEHPEDAMLETEFTTPPRRPRAPRDGRMRERRGRDDRGGRGRTPRERTARPHGEAHASSASSSEVPAPKPAAAPAPGGSPSAPPTKRKRRRRRRKSDPAAPGPVA
jgi:ATP-dependent RNA helicase RhlB